jgi:phage terminase large subunit-like protein
MIAPDKQSVIERLAMLSVHDREAMLDGLTAEQLEALKHDWRLWARPNQIAPDGDWTVWVLRAGRGFGKNRTGSGWVHERAMQAKRWIALIGKTSADVRDYMIDGPGGIIRNAPPAERPVHQPDKRRVVWPNGSYATLYSGEEPEQLRGFSGDTAWADEFAKYRYPKILWDNLMMGLREPSAGDRPRVLITTTPRPLALLKEIERMPGTVVVTGSSYDNRSNLDPSWYETTLAKYEGTRLGRQEIHAEILDDNPGALWSRRNLDEYRVDRSPPLIRIVVAVDPATTSNEGSDEHGIIVAGVCARSHIYVLDDCTLSGRPDDWGRAAVAAFRLHNADMIVAESNNGGEMVEHVIRSVDPMMNVRLVRASRGKYTRAEPVSAVFQQGRAHIVGSLPELEDQMIEFTPGSAANRANGSPDRVDALVWAVTELFPSVMTPAKEFTAPRRAPIYAPHNSNGWMG